jgi:hypothetical protein
VYDPSSEWANPAIPGDHYQTVVTIKGAEVLNRPGVTFKNLPADVQKAMTVTDGTKPEDIVTRIYWKPGGTPDQSRWVLLMTNQPDPKAVIQLEKKKMKVSYRPPTIEFPADYPTGDFIVAMNPKNKLTKSFGGQPFKATQPIGPAQVPVNVTATCADCGGAHLDGELQQDGDGWVFIVSTKDFPYLLQHAKELNGKRFDIDLTLSGKGEPKKETMGFTLTISSTAR